MKKIVISMAIAALCFCSCGNNGGNNQSEGETAATEQTCCGEENKECCGKCGEEGKECCGQCDKENAEGDACQDCQKAE